MEYLPAALAGRRFLRPTRNDSTPIDGGIIDLHAEPCQQVRCHIAPGFMSGQVLRSH